MKIICWRVVKIWYNIIIKKFLRARILKKLEKIKQLFWKELTFVLFTLKRNWNPGTLIIWKFQIKRSFSFLEPV